MIPDSFTMDDLSNALEDAPSEPEAKEVNNKELTDNELWDLAAEHVLTAAKSCDDRPLVMHKAMVIQIINKMIEFHNAVGEDVLEEGMTDAAAGWFRDAGKLQSICNILTTIQVDSDNDFMLA